jgi:predicted MPP superfamily phosphohydrolase
LDGQISIRREKFAESAELLREPRWLTALRLLAVVAAAHAVWVFTVNRTLDSFVDGWPKQTAFYSSWLLLLFATAKLFIRERRRLTTLALVLLACFALGEVRRLWLRHSYNVRLGSGPTPSLLEPVTTTALGIRRFTHELESLPLPELRVVHVTDFHVTDALPPEYYARVAREIAAQAPDLLLLTGDSVSKIERLGLLERVLAGLPRARYGNVAVVGNHEIWLSDHSQVTRALERAGFSVLRGRCRLIAIPDTPGLRLCGTEEPWGVGLERAEVERVGASTSPLFVLSHTPDNVYALAELGAHVVFAGHTHGGQVRLPWFGSLVVPSSYGRLFDLGAFHVRGTELYVSPGVGADQPPLRLWCPPEIFVIDFNNSRRRPRGSSVP